MNYKKILIVILLIIIVLSSIGNSYPTKSTVESFLNENSCNPTAAETEYYGEYDCAAYLRRHTASFGGQIINVPKFTLLFVYTPFHYFNYIDVSNPDNNHVYIFATTSDEEMLVYNPVNGRYVGRYDDLLQEMKSLSYARGGN